MTLGSELRSEEVRELLLVAATAHAAGPHLLIMLGPIVGVRQCARWD